MRRRRRPYRALRRKTQTAQGSAPPRTRSRAAAEPLSLNAVRTVVCGVLFVSLIALKLLLPGSLASVRGTLGAWLVRDADFAAAFSAVGHAVSGEGGVLDALEEAYVAVFGAQGEAAEVSGAAEVTETADTAAAAEIEQPAEPKTAPVESAWPEALAERAWPERAATGQHILGFAYAAPLRGKLTSPFGWRDSPREAFHYGVDIAADEGTDILCFADGTVGVVGDSVELGNYLTVHHANGVLTLYAHCRRITVSSGDTVARGDKLAEVGSTGNATGPHLHFEIHDGEEYLDPIYYLS